MASRLLQIANKACRASRAAAVAASRAASLASRSARAAAADAARISAALDPESCPQTKPRDEAPGFSYDDYIRSAAFEQLPGKPIIFFFTSYKFFVLMQFSLCLILYVDDSKMPTEKDLESDEAIWALYERWCKAHNKKRDQSDMARRFKLFRIFAKSVHTHNTCLPLDPKKAATYIRKRQKAKLLILKGQDVSDIEECYLPMVLGPYADGGEPFTERDERMLKEIEEREAVQDVTAH
jgi:hypothetical protein